METLRILRRRWSQLGESWQEVVRAAFHPAYIGMCELYEGITTAEDIIKAMSAYPADLPVWAAYDGGQLIGFLVGCLQDERLTLYDIFISPAFQGQGIGRQLLANALQQPGVKRVVAEVNQANTASQALFATLGFQKTHSSDWLERSME